MRAHCVVCLLFFSGGEGPRRRECVLARAVFVPPRVHHRCLRVLAISPIAIGHGAVAD